MKYKVRSPSNYPCTIFLIVPQTSALQSKVKSVWIEPDAMNFLLIEIYQSSKRFFIFLVLLICICGTFLCRSVSFLIINTIQGSGRYLAIFRRYIWIWLLWRRLSQISLIFRNLWWSFLRRPGRGFFRRIFRPRVKLIMWIRIRAWLWV